VVWSPLPPISGAGAILQYIKGSSNPPHSLSWDHPLPCWMLPTLLLLQTLSKSLCPGARWRTTTIPPPVNQPPWRGRAAVQLAGLNARAFIYFCKAPLPKAILGTIAMPPTPNLNHFLCRDTPPAATVCPVHHLLHCRTPLPLLLL
jgi:hypothetical protein